MTTAITGGPGPLFASRYAGFLPSAGGTAVAQIRECLELLRADLRASGLTDREILRLTFFVNATGPGAYARQKNKYAAVLRDSFGALHPPASFVAQPPEKRREVALEATVLSRRVPGLRVTRKSLVGLPYALVTGADFREVHGAGIASENPAGDISSQAKEAFEKMQTILRRERLTFGHVVRQWNYIEDIIGVRRVCGKSCQNYQAFNDVRTLFYGSSDFASGYPAATGVGQAAGGVILEFTALEAPAGVRIVPLSNPRQVDAHRYSPGVLVGESIEEMTEKTSPKFERAKLVADGQSGTVFVSGTAAVLGQKSIGRRDVEAQTRTTIDNIMALVSRESLARAGIAPGRHSASLSYLRAYAKRAADIPKVRRECERAFGRIPALYVSADICRPELLVELEGIKLIEALPR